MTTNEWREECNYISNQTDTIGGQPGVRRCDRNASFNYDRQCFIRYCEMQRNGAEREGVHDAAQYIDHCLDDLKV